MKASKFPPPILQVQLVSCISVLALLSVFNCDKIYADGPYFLPWVVTEIPEPGPYYVPVVASTDTHGPWNCESCNIPDHGDSYEDYPITNPCHHEADFEWDMTDPQSPTKVYSGAYIGSWKYQGSTSTGALEDAVDEEFNNPPLTYLQIKMDAAFATIAPSPAYIPAHFTDGGDWFGSGTGTNAPATVTPEVWHWDVTPCMVEKIEFRKHKDVKEL